MIEDDTRHTLAKPAGGWTFAGMGAEFDHHVARHLPGYADVQRLVALVASFVIPTQGGVFADLGASTGRTARDVVSALPGRDIECHLYDRDASMLTEARRQSPTVRTHQLELPARLEHRGAHLTVALWLLQFLSPDRRCAVLAEAHRTAADTGAILIATKVRMRDYRWGEIAAAALDDYKADAGVSPDERAAKTASLRGVLQTPTTSEVAADLIATGWHEPVVLWRWHIWAVIGAWKTESRDDLL